MPQKSTPAVFTILKLQEPLIQSLTDNNMRKKNIDLRILRLDMIHPIASGNKIFKLAFFLDQAQSVNHKTLLTFGGAYSNHLAATAFAGAQLQLRTIGIIRGEQPPRLSHTLEYCLSQGMELEFVSRNEYRELTKGFLSQRFANKFGSFVVIPEGGHSKAGAEGASLIWQHIPMDVTHVCVAIGTATTFAGIIKAAPPNVKIVGLPILKNMRDIAERLKHLLITDVCAYDVVDGYHFNGYAKKNDQLVKFMNLFYEETRVPLDFVYTAKMMYGVKDLISKDYFPNGSRILCIHTGGLQGNLSLPFGTLKY